MGVRGRSATKPDGRRQSSRKTEDVILVLCLVRNIDCRVDFPSSGGRSSTWIRASPDPNVPVGSFALSVCSPARYPSFGSRATSVPCFVSRPNVQVTPLARTLCRAQYPVRLVCGFSPQTLGRQAFWSLPSPHRVFEINFGPKRILPTHHALIPRRMRGWGSNFKLEPQSHTEARVPWLGVKVQTHFPEPQPNGSPSDPARTCNKDQSHHL